MPVADWYYLVAQLPSFSVNQEKTPLPITGDAFVELCARFFDPESLQILESISLEPPRFPAKTGSFVVDSWNEMENSLRVALAQLRSQKLGRDFAFASVSIRPEASQAARAALTMDSPLAAEQSLNEFRTDFLNRIAPVNNFSTEAVYVYALKLRLAERIRKFNDEAGMASYRSIYDRILGDAK
jgi:hypothetical protein